MAEITLHRAARILDAINVKLRASTPPVSTKLSIFSESVGNDIATAQQACRNAVTDTERLLGIKRVIRTAVFAANAKHGVFEQLAAKNAFDDLVAALEKIPGVAPAEPAKPDDEYSFRRRKKPEPLPMLDVAAAIATANATKARFAGTDSEIRTELEVSTVTVEDSKQYRRMATETRRRADVCAEELRRLNASHTITVSDDIMDWLTTQDVV